jgi:Cd2+/Zn2+-exporting ATPase
VEKAVKRMPGVIDAAVIFPAGRLNVEFNPEKTAPFLVVAQVKRLGYESWEESKSTTDEYKTTDFCITGLDCADCAARLEKRIAKIPGVEKARVNFAASSMTVTHNTPVEAILTVIHKMGYSGTVDEGRGSRTDPLSFWNANRFAKPTIVSFIMFVLGFMAGKLGAPEIVANGLFILGIVLGGFLPAKNGLSVLINALEFDINLLMMIAVIGAAVIGEFEEAAAVVFLFSLGNALQGYTLDKTRDSIRALMELAPNEALVRRGTIQLILPVEDIIIGDIIVVKPGERIAMDGRVAAGYSTVNQAPITGESIAVEKQPGDEVYAGTINERGSLEVKVTRLAKDNTISRIIDMVEEAQGQRAPSQQFIDKFARYYTPAVIILAVMVAVVPTLMLHQPWGKWFYEAMALLLVACPCALVISTRFLL